MRKNEIHQTDSIPVSRENVLFVVTFLRAMAGMASTHTGRRGTKHPELATIISGWAFRDAYDIINDLGERGDCDKYDRVLGQIFHCDAAESNAGEF